MPDPAALQRNRRAVDRLLVELQALPGFEAQLRALPRLPTKLANWEWRHVVRTADGLSSGRNAMRSVTQEERDREKWDPNDPSRWPKLWQTDDATGELITPTAEPPPTADVLADISEYRTAVAEFAAHFVFHARWGPRAVHGALRRDSDIRVPPALPLPFLTSDVTVQINLVARQPISPETADDLRRWFEGLHQHPEHARLEQEKRGLREQADAALASAEGQLPGAVGHRQALSEYGDLVRKQPAGGLGSFDGTARAGLSCVRRRLANESPTDSEARAYRRLAKYLDAALDAAFDRVPLELAADADTKRVRRAVTAGAQALIVGTALQGRAPEPSPPSQRGSSGATAVQRRHRDVT